MDDHTPYPQATNHWKEGIPAELAGGGLDPTAVPLTATTQEVDAYRQLVKGDNDAHRAYHLHRITSKFKTTISPEGAQRLARLLAADDDAHGPLTR